MMMRFFVLRDETNARALWAFLKSNWSGMARIGKPLAITVQEHKAKRSDAQNRLFHALLSEIAEKAWVEGERYDQEAWKEHVRRKFIGTEEWSLPDGTRLERGVSTTTLSVSDFSDLIDRMTHWAVTDLGVEFEGHVNAMEYMD